MEEIKKEDKFIVLNKEHIGSFMNSNPKEAEKLLDSLKFFRDWLGRENSYIICNQDEPYAENVWNTILEGERDKVREEEQKKKEITCPFCGKFGLDKTKLTYEGDPLSNCRDCGGISFKGEEFPNYKYTDQTISELPSDKKPSEVNMGLWARIYKNVEYKFRSNHWPLFIGDMIRMATVEFWKQVEKNGK